MNKSANLFELWTPLIKAVIVDINTSCAVGRCELCGVPAVRSNVIAIDQHSAAAAAAATAVVLRLVAC